MKQTRYGFSTTLEGIPFDEARERVVSALKDEGFGVLTEIDVRATLDEKLGVDFRPYQILGACNPELAKQALDEEDDIGLLLPCNVVVQRADEDAVRVSIADPRAMFELVDRPAVASVAEEAERRLRRVLASLAAQSGA